MRLQHEHVPLQGRSLSLAPRLGAPARVDTCLVQERQEARERKDSPVVKKWSRVKKTLVTFAQLAMDNERADVANSVTAFISGTGRLVEAAPKAPKKRRSSAETTEL